MPRSTANPCTALTDRLPEESWGRSARGTWVLAEPECTNPNPKETTMFRILTASAMLTLTLTLHHAAAQAAPVTSVQFGDLNLSRAADAQVLNGRIEKAAETACTPLHNARPMVFYHAWFAHCVSEATARTSARIATLTSANYRAVASK